jgi:hypothetical protein
MITFLALLGCLIPSAIAFNALGTGETHPLIVPHPPELVIVLKEDPKLKAKGIKLPGYNH